MASSFTVVYDACILYPAALRNLFMHLALIDLYRARWTDAIHEEWTRNLIADRPDLAPDLIYRTRDLMDKHVRDAKVSGFEHLIPAVDLPDPDDAHVVAAAIHCHASTIVTRNLKDFPAEVLGKFAIEAQHPDDFVVGQFGLNQLLVLKAMADHRRSLRKPPKSADAYLDSLAAHGLTQTISIVRPYAAAI